MAAAGDDPLRDDGLREEAAAWLARLRGPSTPEDHAAFEAWYNATPEHAEAYDAVLRTWETAGLAKLTPAGQARSPLRPAGLYRWRYAIAAMAATVVIALLAFGAYGAGSIAPGVSRPVRFASGPSEIRTIGLADGSRITLDAASLLQTAYSAEERRVRLLHGRARFAVARNAERPFVVATPLGLVVAHGTLFDVAYDGKRVTVSLLEGSIEVRRFGAPSKSVASRNLLPGQSVIVDASEIRAPVRSREAGWNWPTGMISFDGAALDEVVAAANRHGIPYIILADPSLAKLRFTGTFNPADTEELARLIAATFKLELSRRHGGALVLSRSGSALDSQDKKIPG